MKIRHKIIILTVAVAQVLLASCASHKMPQEDMAILKNIRTGDALKIIEDKYGDYQNFNYYWSSGKRLLDSKFQHKISIYGIVDKNEINDCIATIKNMTIGAPEWYRVELTFYERETILEPGGRKNEKQLYKIII